MFINWDDSEKDDRILSIMQCALDYCLFVTNAYDKLEAKKFRLYLDTNIIFRTLGINVEHRKIVIENLLSKAKKCGAEIVALAYTSCEFFNTIDYYLQDVSNLPRGRIFQGAYELLSDFNIFEYYDSWCNEHSTTSIPYFKAYIRTSYQQFVEKFSVIETPPVGINIYSNAEKAIIAKYNSNMVKTKSG